MGGERWVAQFAPRLPLLGSLSEEGVYPLRQDTPSPVLESELLDGAPDKRKARTPAWKSGSAAQVSAPISLPTRDHFSSAVKALMAKCSGRPLVFAKAERSAVYVQLSLAPEQRKLGTITLRDPQSADWRAFLPNTRLRGGVAEARQHHCLSRILANIASRHLMTSGSLLPFFFSEMLSWRLQISTESSESSSSYGNRNGPRASRSWLSFPACPLSGYPPPFCLSDLKKGKERKNPYNDGQ